MVNRPVIHVCHAAGVIRVSHWAPVTWRVDIGKRRLFLIIKGSGTVFDGFSGIPCVAISCHMMPSHLVAMNCFEMLGRT